jgi:ferrous iron transport protein A
MNNRSPASKANPWHPFVYENESPNPEREGRHEDNPSEIAALSAAQSPITALANAKVGDRVCIVSLNCGESNSRLMGMGLVPGVVLEVISSTATGSVILALQDQRLGLGLEMAQHIQISPVTTLSKPDRAKPTAARKTTMSTIPEQSTLKLRDVAIGSTLRVVGYEPTARDYKRKLLAMGLTPGTELIVKRHAPLGDPTEIEVRDFHLSLRKAEADSLIVELVTGE